MRKFLQKYKYTSLITGALTITVLSGIGGAFIHNKYTNPKLWQEAWDITDRHATRVFDLWDQCHHKKGRYALEKPQNADKLHPSHYKALKEIDVVSTTHLISNDDHDHEDESCCEACSKGLPCTGEIEKKKKKVKSKVSNASNVDEELPAELVEAWERAGGMPHYSPLGYYNMGRKNHFNKTGSLQAGHLGFSGLGITSRTELIEKAKAVASDAGLALVYSGMSSVSPVIGEALQEVLSNLQKLQKDGHFILAAEDRGNVNTKTTNQKTNED